MKVNVKDVMTTRVIWVGKEVAADVRSEFPAHPDAIHIAVKDGVVTLTGVAQPGKASKEIMRRIRHIQGVVAARDQLSYLPPRPEGFDVLASFPID